MNLVVDVGNSFVKVAVFHDGTVILHRRFRIGNATQEMGKMVTSFPQLEKVIVSNVQGKDLDLPENLENTVLLELNFSTKLPFTNLYQTPSTLGNDRKALMAAAVQHFPKKNVLVIDAGTCLTFDFKNSKDEYLGGSISPGLHMRYKALHQYTGRLPLLGPEENVELIGSSTKGSVSTGVVFGMVKEIDGFIEEYKARYEDLTVIFTGGDTQFLSMRLKNSIFANSNFLFEGLNYILEFNNNQ